MLQTVSQGQYWIIKLLCYLWTVNQEPEYLAGRIKQPKPTIGSSESVSPSFCEWDAM